MAHAVLTHACNLSCAHCYQAEHASRDLSVAEWEGVFEQLASLGVLHLTLGGGEPLSHRGFWDILAAARRLKFAVVLFTNGTLIDEPTAARLAAAHLLRVEVNLHGEAPTHDAFTGMPGAFARTEAAIEHLKRAGVRVRLKGNLVQQNRRELVQLQRRFDASPQVRTTTAIHVYPRDDGDRTALSLRVTEAQELEWARAALAGKNAEQLSTVLKDARARLGLDESRTEACGAGRRSLAVLPNGDVTACTVLHHVLGNVRARALRDIWADSPFLGRLRSLHASDYLSAHEECRTCEWRRLCRRCPALSETASGQLDGFSPQVCQSTRVWWRAVRERAAALGLEFP